MTDEQLRAIDNRGVWVWLVCDWAHTYIHGEKAVVYIERTMFQCPPLLKALGSVWVPTLPFLMLLGPCLPAWQSKLCVSK